MQPFGLPEVVAVNWGQWHGPYALPPEHLVICAGGGGFLWKQTSGGPPNQASVLRLGPPQLANLFQLILSEWPQGALERSGQDGKFIWLLDRDYNFFIAPVMQAKGPDGAIEEVKHGDLSPGITFFGDNDVAGPYRGVARFGGEFNLAGVRDGKEWIMHAKSGYTAYRVSVDKAQQYYSSMRRAGKSDPEIAHNFAKCVFGNIFRGRTPLTRLLCYLRRQLRVHATLGITCQCDIRARLVDGLPNLGECFPKDPGDDQVCADEVQDRPGAPIVHLVDWYAPSQARCNLTPLEYEGLLDSIGGNIKTFLDFGPSVAGSNGGRAYAESIASKIRSVRKHSCLFTDWFASQLHCNVHGCFRKGEGFTQELKNVQSLLAGDLSDGYGLLEDLWMKVVRTWGQCKSGLVADEL